MCGYSVDERRGMVRRELRRLGPSENMACSDAGSNGGDSEGSADLRVRTDAGCNRSLM